MTELAIEEEAHLAAAPARVWEVFFSDAGNVAFSGYGPVPGLTRLEWLEGDESTAGSIARVSNADGSTHRERVVRSDPPHGYLVSIDALSSSFRLLVREIREELVLREEPGGTHLERRFTFVLTSPLALPVAAVVRVFFRRAVRRHHENLAKLL